MPISVQCPGCGKSLHGKDELAGKRAKCPKCGHPFSVPNLATQSASEKVDSESTTSIIGSDQPNPVPQPVNGATNHGALIVILALCLLASLVWTALGARTIASADTYEKKWEKSSGTPRPDWVKSTGMQDFDSNITRAESTSSSISWGTIAVPAVIDISLLIALLVALRAQRKYRDQIRQAVVNEGKATVGGD